MATVSRLNVLIEADAQQFERTMKKAQRRMEGFGRDMGRVGRQLTTSISLPLLGIGVAAGKAFIDFESSFAGIRKTMNLTEGEFQKLAQANRDLAKTIPVTVNELNRIGELAGQLGIRGVSNVLKFEDTIAKLAVTTDLTADQAALAFAQIANVLQLPQDQIDRLGSTIVDLGNNFATTESRIVDFTRRIAGAGKIAGLSAGDVAGIGAAFASLGIEAQLGGTAVQKVLIAMLSAVAQGGKELQVFARTAGVSSDEFAKAFQENAAGAFADFVEGLGRQGKAAIDTLNKLGLKDQRLIRAFLGAAGAGDILRRALERGNTAFTENIALTTEAAKRFQTAASQLRVFWNRVKDISITLGNAFVPLLIDALDALQSLVDTVSAAAERFAEMPKWVRLTAVAIGGLLIAIGPLLIVLGSLVNLLASLTIILGPVAIGFAPLATAVAVGGALALGLLGIATATGFVVKALNDAGVASRKAAADFDNYIDTLEEVGRTGTATEIFFKLENARAELRGVIADTERFRRLLTDAGGAGSRLGSSLAGQLAIARGRASELQTTITALEGDLKRAGEAGALRVQIGDPILIEAVTGGLGELSSSLRSLNSQAQVFDLSGLEVAEERAALLRSTLVSLLDEGLNPQSNVIEQLRIRYDEATASVARLRAELEAVSTIDASKLQGILAPTSGTLAEQALGQIGDVGNLDTVETSITESMTRAQAAAMRAAEQFQVVGQAMIQAVSQGLLDGANFLERVFVNILTSLLSATLPGIGPQIATAFTGGGGASVVSGASSMSTTVVVDMSGAVLFGDPATTAREPGSQVFIREGTLAAQESGF